VGVCLLVNEHCKTDKEWLWKPSQAEELTMWVPNQDKSESIQDLLVHGMTIEEIQHVGPPYKEVMAVRSLVAATPTMDKQGAREIQTSE
jgi:hypothetical protein